MTGDSTNDLADLMTLSDIYRSFPPKSCVVITLHNPAFSVRKDIITSYQLTYNSYPSAPSHRHLLLSFIPRVLRRPYPHLVNSFKPTIPSEHTIFLAHLSRYPYLTSHDNYIRHSGYVLNSADDTPAHYLILQEFSDLRQLHWDLKRKEAKDWWRTKERGASGVRVGFFKLADVEEINRYVHK